ncbi:MAG: hypothetical protein ACOX4S_02640 [Anaerovoracaceae bacterium]
MKPELPERKIDYFLELRNSGKNICQPYADQVPWLSFRSRKETLGS